MKTPKPPVQFPPLAVCAATTLSCAVAIWVPLQMQSLVLRPNEVCFGPFTDADYSALLSIRLQTWGASFVATGLCLAALVWIGLGRMWTRTLIALFVIWKGATLYFDINGSPICWEPYENDTPFWDEPVGTGVAFIVQPVAFAAFSLALVALTLGRWFSLAKSTT